MKSICIIICLIFCSFFNVSEEKAVPEKYFGSQYKDALIKVKENKALLENAGAIYRIDTRIAVSVVFPEMLRCSLWKDFFETKTLETLYVVKGQEAADFSIGWFQMKPSFAERTEQEISANPENRLLFKELLHYDSDSADICEIRRERISRLKSFETQMQYLMAFILTAQEKMDKAGIPESDRLIYLTALYNRGIDCNLSEIKEFKDQKTFPYGSGHENPFSYFELSEYFYKNYSYNILK